MDRRANFCLYENSARQLGLYTEVKMIREKDAVAIAKLPTASIIDFINNLDDDEEIWDFILKTTHILHYIVEDKQLFISKNNETHLITLKQQVQGPQTLFTALQIKIKE